MQLKAPSTNLQKALNPAGIPGTAYGLQKDPLKACLVLPSALNQSVFCISLCLKPEGGADGGD